ncbi:MAG: hypothetical protein A4E67_00727 [Syntrophaceae bacterium PtaB.Bin038]|jgi:DNA-directed RNA polymerase specialized sigma24 family protein|nr:MAG: hypothetical protein A4E67_00727 [Syntrophaceae bacterium PtaB.Bin038]
MGIMDIEPRVFFAIQVLADVVLCVAVVFILGRVNRELKRKSTGIDPASLAELKRVIDDSQRATTSLLGAMEESKKALRDISRSIDEKEARLRDLMETASARIDELDEADAGAKGARREDGNEDVIRLAGQGFTPAEIAGTLGLTEGEIRLILDLARRRVESR